ncbi:MAG: stress protein [Bacteroidales bacterium]|nr:stress protein [Bacteroidales bacterium]
MAINLNSNNPQCTIPVDVTALTPENEIVINLSWNSEPKGFFRILKRSLDLDLGCYYKLSNGKQMLIDALQFSKGRGGQRDEYSRQGCYTEPPFIWHTGDDRSRDDHQLNDTGETILINPIGIPMIQKMVIYGFVYGSAPRWNESDARISILIPGSEPVIIHLDSTESEHNFCVFAQLDFSTLGQLTITRLATYHHGHKGVEDTYHWGFNYTPGIKD